MAAPIGKKGYPVHADRPHLARRALLAMIVCERVASDEYAFLRRSGASSGEATHGGQAAFDDCAQILEPVVAAG